MKKDMLRITIAGLLSAAVLFAPVAGSAQDKPKDSPEKKEAPSERTIPFRGKVAAIDKTAKTVTVGERVFHISSTTRVEKDGKPAALADGVVGEQVTGSYTKGDDGKLTAKLIRFNPKPAAGEKPPKKDDAAGEK
jgi:hypothetical protein